MLKSVGILLLGLCAFAIVATQAPRREYGPAQAAAAIEHIAAPDGAIGNGVGSVRLKRADDGHFYAEAIVNGADVRFLVDTGATSLVLTRSDARRAGLGEGDFTATGVGLGGEVGLRPVRLQRVAMGPIVADGVDAMVAERGLPVSLMGQSFLARIATVTIKGDAMDLR